MRFIEPWAGRNETPFIRTNAASGYEYMNFKWIDRLVQITDARPIKADFQLDQHGFAYRDDAAGGTPEMLQLLRDDRIDKVKTRYYPHVEDLIKRETGASRVVVFDHTSRRRRPEMGRMRIRRVRNSRRRW